LPSCTTINVAAGGFAGPITINRKVTIRGAGQELTFFDGLFLHQVVTIGPAATAEITGVTIQGGFTTREGGGIHNTGMLTLKNSTVTANAALGGDVGQGGGRGAPRG
jgi:hypothetical protein